LVTVTPPAGAGSRPAGAPASPAATSDSGISPLAPGAPSPNSVTAKLPSHIEGWQLPAGWSWGAEGVQAEFRHYQEVVDALGRSLSLVTVPDPAQATWLGAEARALAHRAHASIPTAYDWWPVVCRAVEDPRTCGDGFRVRAWPDGFGGWGRTISRHRCSCCARRVRRWRISTRRLPRTARCAANRSGSRRRVSSGCWRGSGRCRAT